MQAMYRRFTGDIRKIFLGRREDMQERCGREMTASRSRESEGKM